MRSIRLGLGDPDDSSSDSSSDDSSDEEDGTAGNPKERQASEDGSGPAEDLEEEDWLKGKQDCQSPFEVQLCSCPIMPQA